MAFIKEHERDCEEFLGKPYTEVHMWLDQYASLFPVGFFNDYHRSFNHNSYGLECIRSLYGDDAEKAARIHIIRDYLEGPIDKEDVGFYIDGKGFNLMISKMNNPRDITFHYSVVEAWIKEGFGLVCLAVRNIVYVKET
jgi:hypothetical protein